MVVASRCKSFSEAVEGREDQSLFEVFSEFVREFFNIVNILISKIQRVVSGTVPKH
ncbi:hypothetical protein IscW_ISCW015832 [Ixodes scapularis]|uniref:Uncharacterized protein n=1 Tax=Ixodes scapularis TaxID=6945 RepID=B7P492_IXOSC|nr:hypothetical protein IscW_ISCW015832 [Ixodes scapularis]|eukprot:XP_002405641.1 hypothetical protein IscW_ISCW015832 [Ixodes scapularis]